jgi:hypothetical protein
MRNISDFKRLVSAMINFLFEFSDKLFVAVDLAFVKPGRLVLVAKLTLNIFSGLHLCIMYETVNVNVIVLV